ncbi:bifunctional 3,4-dihydroxy-2-butanone 4-phosphate synthase/GTP cyclohydrolase II [Helicobacter cetorum]|uniref:bifunctional 3,4-dihydroxy-2-butanone 4-phosphate synthase/GTP cyclohydrolase II n=1 Tax=Helicobacter cetorum TaxID=138563 RepID=UPI000CF10A1D|nr:bifunctional 3,4-dihydroxy-2-butanone 4-phosphate synthase/GTP cyclohydrolase II [Helicobacter cetorum]
MFLKRVTEALEAYKNGEMLIVMDDEDRENEGDLVLAGIFSSPEKINFMATHARGLICVSLTKDLAKKFELPPMVNNNDSNHETAFTVSIDAKEAKTGISAFERHLTIDLLCKDTTKPSDFVRPGHIFPLIAKDGGVLERTGHTEASVDLCKLAGLKPVSVICEIMKEDGSMARRGDKFLSDFATKHNLKTLYVSDLISYRLQHENLLKMFCQEEKDFLKHKVQCYTFLDHQQKNHYAFKFKGSAPNDLAPLVRFHPIKEDFDFLTSGAFDVFFKALELLEFEGGYLIFMHTHTKESNVVKNFGVGALVLKNLGIESFRLLSSSEDKEYKALSGFGLKLVETINL